jgi:urease accessory protein
MKIILLLVASIMPTFAYAHAGAGDVSGFLRGFLHPLGGIDHVLAMVAVGLWAGLLTGGQIRRNLAAGAALVVLFALFHGLAHGAEVPADAGGWAYGGGFLIANALLHAIGVVSALLILRRERGLAWS